MSKHWEKTGLSERTMSIISASWRESTKKQYSVYIRKWNKFCSRKSLQIFHADVKDLLNFLSELFFDGDAGYSVINQARSALSSFVILRDNKYDIGNHPLISRFMRGVFHKKPPRPRYKEIWDASIVLNYLRKLSPRKKLDLRALTLKLCTLIALLAAQRVQSLHLLNLDCMVMKESEVIFHFKELLKQSRPGNADSTLRLKAYAPDRRLCIVHYLKEYIKRTETIRGQERALLISYQKPHKQVTTATISRWIKNTMAAAGINTDVYKAHSTRAASSSAANDSNLPIKSILEQAGWSNEKTFQQYYKKPREKTKTKMPNLDFASAVIGQ